MRVTKVLLMSALAMAFSARSSGRCGDGHPYDVPRHVGGGGLASGRSIVLHRDVRERHEDAERPAAVGRTDHREL